MIIVKVMWSGKTTDDTTIEDPSVKDPRDRLRVFGQEDHVRIYGNDFIGRLNDAGFLVKINRKEDLITPAEDQEYALASEKEVVFVSKS